jgi:hypothetical protein
LCPLRKISECADHLVVKVGGGERILRLSGRQGPLRSECEPPEPAARRIQRGPIEIPRWIVDAVPPFEDVEESVLHQLLGLMGVPDDEVEGTVEPCMLVREEVLEGQRYGGRLRVHILGKTR